MTEYFILPLDHESRAQSSWEETTETSLGGFFYDHIKSQEGDLVGVRYYIDDSIDPKAHPIFQCFLADCRFHFDVLNGYIDIFFTAHQKNNSFIIDTTQDFGGDYVLKNDGQYGIKITI